MTGDDPRLSGEFVRRVPATDDRGEIVIVGVVHDHPASEHRVAATIDRVDPDRVALELPPLALPLFERHARDDSRPPALGGEMSVAIQAADTDDVVGIDGPSRTFLWRLAGTLWQERVTRDTATGVLGRLATVTKTALACRLAALVAVTTGARIAVDPPAAYPVTRADDPPSQAEDERTRIARARNVLDALAAPRASRYTETVREEHMADGIERAAAGGAVVAVVGVDHLDPVTDRLTGSAD